MSVRIIAKEFWGRSVWFDNFHFTNPALIGSDDSSAWLIWLQSSLTVQTQFIQNFICSLDSTVRDEAVENPIIVWNMLKLTCRSSIRGLGVRVKMVHSNKTVYFALIVMDFLYIGKAKGVMEKFPNYHKLVIFDQEKVNLHRIS